MISGFTADAGAVEAAIRPAAQRSALLESAQDEQAVADVASSMNGVDGGAMQNFVADTESYQTDPRVLTTLDALDQLGRYRRTVPGRKNLIWFSASFPLQIQPDASSAQPGARQLGPFFAVRDYSAQVRATDALLAAARVAVYPVDARGLMVFRSVGTSLSFNTGQGLPAAAGGRGLHRDGWAPPPVSGPSAANQADSRFLQQITNEFRTMRLIADDTGGEAFYSTNSLKEAVAQAIANGSNYYALGYLPAAKRWDGQFRTIQV
jgi:VWFA-related protein